MSFSPQAFFHQSNQSDKVQPFAFPIDHPVFESHFPGNPIIPGILQFACAHQFIQSSFGTKLKLIEIRKSKHKKQLPAGETHRIVINSFPENNSLPHPIQFSIENSQGVEAAKYNTLWGEPFRNPAGEFPDPKAIQSKTKDFPQLGIHEIEREIPLRPPMRMVSQVDAQDVESAWGYFEIPEQHPLLIDAQWPTYYCLEAVGQLIATGFGFQKRKQGEHIIQGYLGGIKRFHMYQSGVPGGNRVYLHSQIIENADDVYLHRFWAYFEGQCIGQGEYVTFLQSAPKQYFLDQNLPLPEEVK